MKSSWCGALRSIGKAAIMRILHGMAIAIITMGMAVATYAAAATGGSSSQPCRITPVMFEDWHAQQVSNDWVRLTIVPQLGGRLMQVSFGGHDYLFVNRKYKGQYIPPSAAAGRWINYGGDKIWPMPEGDQDEHHWVLKSDPLDDGEYTFRVVSQGTNCSSILEGPPDPVTGLQYSREISIGSDSPEISFHATMKNIADHPITWSVQSVTQYDLASHTSSNDFNHDFFAFTPVNPHSDYFAGYQVRNGLADDPSFEVKDGLFRLRWLYLENEVWLDSPAGWLAVVDGSAHFAMVERFTYQQQADYPGKATTILYKNGVSITLDGNLVPRLTGGSSEETPFYMEAELNSPMVSLRPGDSYRFDTDWFPTRAGNAFFTVNSAGMVAIPAAAVKSSKGVLITGSFGVFFPGTVVVRFFDAHGAELGQMPIGVSNPLEVLKLSSDVAVPAGTAKISIHVLDNHGMDRGILGEADVKVPSGATA
jgi:hypothetical protein